MASSMTRVLFVIASVILLLGVTHADVTAEQGCSSALTACTAACVPYGGVDTTKTLCKVGDGSGSVDCVCMDGRTISSAHAASSQVRT